MNTAALIILFALTPVIPTALVLFVHALCRTEPPRQP